MSRENVELIRQNIEAFNRGDLDRALDNSHPEVEWHAYMSPEGQVARGPEEVRKMWEELRSVFGGFQWQAKEFIDAGDAVITVGELRGLHPGAAGVEVAAPIAQVYWIEDGRLKTVRSYRSVEDARRAAGLTG
jgi:ketosteroid isomerase-like protein